MKKIKIFLSIISLILLTCNIFSCKQFESLTNFLIQYKQEAVIKSSVGINLPFNINTPPRTTDSETEFENNNTKKDFIKSIFLDKLSLELTDPENEDFSFLEKIEIFINADGLDEILVASLNPVPPNSSNYINLIPTEMDLQQFIKKDQFSLRINVVTDELLTRDHHFIIHSDYAVKAEIIE